MDKNKIIGTVLSAGLPMLDKFVPGYKTLIVCSIGLGMAICELGSWHIFTEQAWALVKGAGATTMALKFSRDK